MFEEQPPPSSHSSYIADVLEWIRGDFLMKEATISLSDFGVSGGGFLERIEWRTMIGFGWMVL